MYSVQSVVYPVHCKECSAQDSGHIWTMFSPGEAHYLQCTGRTTILYTVLHCTALQYFALCCTALHYNTLHFAGLDCTALQYFALCWSALNCTTLHCAALHCHCTTILCTVLHCCTSLHCHHHRETRPHCCPLHQGQKQEKVTHPH